MKVGMRKRKNRNEALLWENTCLREWKKAVSFTKNVRHASERNTMLMKSDSEYLTEMEGVG